MPGEIAWKESMGLWQDRLNYE